MRVAITAMAVSMLLAGCASDYGYDGPPRTWRNYDYNRPDPAYGGYDASRYYREGPRYPERVLNKRDRIYRGQDDRYYCRRSDGTTGLIVGAIAGGVLGNVITRGDSKILGTIIGAGVGGAIGQAVDRGDVRCR